MAPQRIVLAYSGGLDATVAIRWLIERYEADVVAVTLEIGQGGELTDIRERALAAGAVRAHVIDAREEFARDYILPTLQAGVEAGAPGARFVRAGVEAGAPGANPSPLATPLARALIAKRLVDVARMEGASAVSFVESAPARMDALVRALDPYLTVIAPDSMWEMSASEKVEYARARGIPAPVSTQTVYRADANLWGRCITAAAGVMPSNDVYTLTRVPDECPDEPAYLEIEFEAGVPVRANGIDMPMLELIESLEIIAGAHGVGRIPVDAGLSGAALEVHEAPAAVVLHAAHAALEALVITPDLQRVKHHLAGDYADLADKGLWYSDTRHAIDAFVRTIQPRVTGTVRLRLTKGECRVEASHATSRGGARLDHVTAQGLIS